MLDLFITGADVYDGLGSPPIKGKSLGIRGERIVFPIEPDKKPKAKRTIKADGLALCPGFINIHSHSDLPFLIDGRVPSSLHQGITTEVTGNCGMSMAPLYGKVLEEAREGIERSFDVKVTWNSFTELFDLYEKQGISINILPLIGHGTLRGSAAHMSNRPLNPEEMEKVKEELRKAMKEGVWGLSTGLIYPPGSYAPTEELIELAKIAAEEGGFYASHIRGEGTTLIQAISEALEIGKKANVPVEISHLKAAGEKNWGKTATVLEMIRKARKEGIFVRHDQYPYTASSTGLSMLVDERFHDGGKTKLVERMKDPKTREEIKEIMKTDAYSNGKTVIVSSVRTEKNKKFEGMKISDGAELTGKSVFDFVLDLLIEEECDVGAVYMSMTDEDVRRVMVDPYTSIGSDASARALEGPLKIGKPHPRTYGTFPRVLGHYALREKLFTLEEGIRKMTSLPASFLGLRDRGTVADGNYADLVLFDPEKIIDKSTYDNPHQYPAGINLVTVNGRPVLENGEIAEIRPGRVLRKNR